jgi:putative transposase
MASGQQDAAELSQAEQQLVRELTDRAREDGLKLTGAGGLLGRLTKMVIEGALEGEMDSHLGYSRHSPEGRNNGNSRNGHRAKTVVTEASATPGQADFGVTDRNRLEPRPEADNG